MSETMSETVIETERKFSLDAGFVMPDLRSCAARVEVTGTVDLRATYFDTADLRLLGAGATLRRRSGGSDSGWHLKLPSGGDRRRRLELQRPLAAGEGPDGLGVPADLARLAFARTRGAALAPVAELRTLRTNIELRDRAGALLAVLSDDDVTAALPTGATRSWRELEIEQADGCGEEAERVVRHLARLLVENGARPDESGPKLAHGLGVELGSRRSPAAPSAAGAARPRRRAGGRHHLRPGGAKDGLRAPVEAASATADGAGVQPPARPLLIAGGQHLSPPPAGAPGPTRQDGDAGPAPAARRLAPAAAAVVARIAEQTEELALRDVDVRRGEDDAVHKMRVACRRLLWCLRSFSDLFEGSAPELLRGELRWLAHLLGEVRDAEVLRAALVRRLDALPPEQVLGPVRANLGGRLAAGQAGVQAALAEAMGGERYAALLDSLACFVGDPPVRAMSGKGSRRLIAKAVRRDLRRVRRRMGEGATRSGRGRNELLHEARKAAKRARYALEAVEPLYPRRAGALAARYEALQEALGDQHDALVVGALLREEGARAGVRPGENGYTYGLLAGLAQAAGEAAEADAWRQFASADLRKRRRFLR